AGADHLRQLKKRREEADNRAGCVPYGTQPALCFQFGHVPMLRILSRKKRLPVYARPFRSCSWPGFSNYGSGRVRCAPYPRKERAADAQGPHVVRVRSASVPRGSTTVELRSPGKVALL